MKRSIFFVILSLLLSSDMMAQLAMGQWRTHFAYSSVTQVAQTPNKIFAVSEGSLFSVDKRDDNVEYYSKLSGLNGTGISCIEYDSTNECLIIVYENGNIDLLRSGGVENIPDLYTKTMASSKSVNSISFYGGKAYLSCDFGIVVLNVQKNEISETYFIGDNASDVQVLSIVVHNGYIYASTPEDIYRADVSNSHLINFEYWSKLSNLPGSGTIAQVQTYNNELFILRGGDIYKFNASTNDWTAIVTGMSLTKMILTSDKLLAFVSDVFVIIDAANNYVYTTSIHFGTMVSDARYDETGNYWLAANESGIIRYDVATNAQSSFVPNGPIVNTPYRMHFSGRKLFVVPGGYLTVYNNTPGAVMMYENGVWTNISNEAIRTLSGNSCEDFSSVVAYDSDPLHFFVASFGYGVYEFQYNQAGQQYQLLNHYHGGNSSLETAEVGLNPLKYTWTDGITLDKDNNLWILNAPVLDGVKVLLNNGTWTSLTNSAVSEKNRMRDFLISNQNANQKWVTTARAGCGIGVFDDNGTITDQDDDRSAFYSVFYDQDNNQLKPEEVYCMAQDADGAIWLATNLGPIVLSNTANVFESGLQCSRIKIPRNDGTDLADFLLDEERVNAIAFDGANRKWIGTASSGLYLMSANGQETVQHFTAKNSPLPSDNILSLAINPETGEVFVGTGGGLVSYQSDAAAGGDSFGNIYAYPNPVRETFNGMITITGLVANTTVKITDVAGNVVCETVSNGSIAVWDGKNKWGQRVSTGVYIAICLSEDGSEKGITKILFIN